MPWEGALIIILIFINFLVGLRGAPAQLATTLPHCPERCTQRKASTFTIIWVARLQALVMQHIMITGTSRGLGLGLARAALNAGGDIEGYSRSETPIDHPNFRFHHLDLANLQSISGVLDNTLDKETIDLVILNAGIIGEFKSMPDISLNEIKNVMEINVWANKLILDWFATHIAPAQVVLISSGAAVNGHRGWGAYALSKATLNMLAQLYSHDMPRTHICALAPGLVDTPMQEQIQATADYTRFPSVTRLREARGTAAMPSATEAGARIFSLLANLPERIPSGSFADVRTL